MLLTALFQHTLINQSRALVLTWAGTAVANVQGCLKHILNLRARASLIALHTLFQLLMEKKKKDRDFTQMASLPLFFSFASPPPLKHCWAFIAGITMAILPKLNDEEWKELIPQVQLPANHRIRLYKPECLRVEEKEKNAF